MNNGTASSSGQLDITTGGSYAHGMTVETDGKVTLEDASATTIKTSGDGSHGIYANGGSAVLNGELEITTAGANDSHGIAAQNNGQVTFAEGSKLSSILRGTGRTVFSWKWYDYQRRSA